MKKIKKGLLAISTITAIATPVAAVVSCGAKNSKEITIGVRAGSLSIVKEISEQYKKATGWDVKLRIIGQKDMSTSYPLWSGSGLIPDITLADANTANTAINGNNSWFQELDLQDIFTNDKYMITGQDEKYKEIKQSTFDSSTFNMTMLNQTLDTKTNKYKSFQYTMGPHLLYYWDTAKDGSTKIFDGTKNLKWYVPNASGDGVVEVTKFNGSSSPLLKPGTQTPYKNTPEDIQEFLNNSALKSQIQFNAGGGTNENAYTADFQSPTDSKNRVVSTGTLGFYQRLNSVGISVLGEQTSDTIAKSVTLQHEYIVPTGLSQGTAALSTSGTNNVVAGNGKLDDQKWKKQWSTARTVNNSNITPLQAAYYDSYFGFFQDKPLGSSKYLPHASTVAAKLSAKDLETPFAEHDVLFTDGAMWQGAGIKAVAEKKLPGSSKHIKAFSLPFGAPGVDGFAVFSKVSGKKLTAVNKFLRFLMQTQVSVKKAGDATVPILVSAKNAQPEATTSWKKAITNAGFKTISGDKIPNLTDMYSLSSTEGTYFKYNNTFDTHGWNVLTKNGTHATRAGYLSRISAMNTIYDDEQKLS